MPGSVGPSLTGHVTRPLTQRRGTDQMAPVQSWRFSDVRTIWTMEVRSALREGHILVNSVLLPLDTYRSPPGYAGEAAKV